MKQLIAIKVQSLTDLITNSSSELFQLRTDKTVEQVEEILSQITEGYIKPVLFTIEKYRKLRGRLDEMISCIEPEYDDPDDIDWEEYWNKREKLYENHPEEVVVDYVDGWFFDPESEKDIRYLYEDYLTNFLGESENDELQNEFEEFVKQNNYIIEPDLNHIYSWNIKKEAFGKFIESHEMPDPITLCKKYPMYYGTINDLDGCIIVVSKEDNSIPWDTFGAINNMFKGINYHLG